MNAIETPEMFQMERVDLGVNPNLVGRARGTENPKATIITGNNNIEAEASTDLVVNLKAGPGDAMITTTIGNLIAIIITGTIIVVAGVWSVEVVVVQIVDPAVDIVLVTIIAITIAVTILLLEEADVLITEADIRVTTGTIPGEVIVETNETGTGVIIDMTIARDIGAIIDTTIAIEWDPSETGTEEPELHHVTVAIVTDREQPPVVGTKRIRRNRPYFPHCHRKYLNITMKSLAIVVLVKC